MSRGVKITLVVIAVILVLCCIGGVAAYFIAQRVAGQAFTTDSKQAARIGQEIADYILPSGYKEVFAMNLAGVKMVAIGPKAQSADAMALVLMQFPAGMNISQRDMERQISQALAQQGQRRNVQMQVVGTQKVTIQGKSVTLTVSEGKAEDGKTIRQVTGVFDGKGGPVMFMAIGAKDSWNEQLLTRFLASIK